MRLVDGTLRFSASDLMRFKGCVHATTLDLRYLEIADIEPDGDDPEAALLQRQGDAHEHAFLERLRARRLDVAEIPKDGLRLEDAAALTADALRRGSAVVFQGAFLDGAWGGYSDFLERVERPSMLGGFSYEVVDTKLKRSPDPKHVLQLALYSDLLAKVQGTAPLKAHLELGNDTRFTVHLGDVSAYARHARRALEDFIEERPDTRPVPVAACGLCRWRTHCQSNWESSDSIVLVAGISSSQREKFEAAGVTTMTQLAGLTERVPQLAPETAARLQTQARLQAARRAGGPPRFALRDFEPGRGFGLLPEPDAGDLFYDIEGDPYYPGGLEYLHGVWLRDGGDWVFRAWWAHDRDEECQAVEDLLAFFVTHLQRHPRAHIYHYANYELAALRRLTSAHRVAEAAMDQLQRELRFVDLYRVVSGALIASEPGYSIKNLEAFYMEKRQEDVATAGASVVFYERWRETRDPKTLEDIRVYNEADCRSTQLLRDWLVNEVRPAGLVWRPPGPLPDGGALANVTAEDAEVEQLRARLAPVADRLGQGVADLVLDLNYFYVREDKPAYWAIFDRLTRESVDLIDDMECLAGLEAAGPPVKVTARSYERSYRYPPQETKLRAGKDPCIKPEVLPVSIRVSALDPGERTVVLRRTLDKGPLPDTLDLIPPKPLHKKVLRDAIAAVTDALIHDPGSNAAVEHLLARTAPVFTGGYRAAVVDREGDLVDEASAAVAAMNRTVLPIQGPPGTGKTYVSARAILDLVRSGHRVAVSSNSHKAISNLLKAVADAAAAAGEAWRIVQKASDDGDDEATTGVTVVSDNNAPEIAAAHVVGATAWHFARYAEPAFSHLFVDEAGQVSLANVVAMSRAARNIVLVGDPMQLPQPLQGQHPGESGSSCLEYLTGGERVIPADRGIFMPVTRRLQRKICDFISAAVYERQLHADDGAAAQDLIDRQGTSVAGVHFKAVSHRGRSQVCPEEIEAVRAAIERLVGSSYRDRNGARRAVGYGDILVVAPYNAQVNALRAGLPDAVPVGTVDRFQGQEAPVCLVSMTTSSAEELPRDIEFLFSLNRINVAVSRAQACAVVFASPLLLETPCRTVEQMALINTLCLLNEVSGDRF